MYPRLRAFREDNDLTQEVLAKVLGMSQTGYSKYETGENDVPTAILIRLSFIYDTNIDYLLGITNHRESYPLNKEQKELYKEYKDRLENAMKEKKHRRSGKSNKD